MNNKEFQTELARRLGVSQKRSAELMKGYVDTLVQQLAEQKRYFFKISY